MIRCKVVGEQDIHVVLSLTNLLINSKLITPLINECLSVGRPGVHTVTR